jgi:hypothetical protein
VRLGQFAPVLLIQLYFVFLRGGFDAFPGGIAFCISHPLNLLESGTPVEIAKAMNKTGHNLNRKQVQKQLSRMKTDGKVGVNEYGHRLVGEV